MIEGETRHGKGCDILRVKSVLNGHEVDLGTIVLVTLPKFVVLQTRR